MNVASQINIDSGMNQLGFYSAANLGDTSTVGGYYHMETSITAPSSNVMMTVEAVGYSYGTGNIIRCAWHFYSYSYVIAGYSNPSAYPGLQANNVYYSGAGYVVIVAYSAQLAYAGFTLNAYPTAGNGTRAAISIRRASQNTNSGNYY
jgi:hypothetical protein